MTVIAHPDRYKSGTRVLMIRGRHKDGVADARKIVRTAHGVDGFGLVFGEMLAMLRPGERIYASAGSRDVAKAVRLFKERQLAADYDADPLAFYRDLEHRWASCLMDTRAQSEKVWLFDCDTASDAVFVRSELAACADLPVPHYEYATKSGTHMIVQAFDRTRLSSAAQALIHENALMLWAY